MKRIVYHPIVTYPDPAAEAGVARAVEMASALGADLEAAALVVEIGRVNAPIGGLLVDMPEMIRASEAQSRGHGDRLAAEVRRLAGEAGVAADVAEERYAQGLLGEVAAARARLCDASLLTWAPENAAMRSLAEGVIFGAGRPAILLPEGAPAAAVDHVAIAWDGSRVAARALGDALGLIGAGARYTVLTVVDEKPLPKESDGAPVADALARRGLSAEAATVRSDGRPIAAALQAEALERGASLLAMGGYGHSRLRDFVLGGATLGVLADLRAPTLLSH